MIWCPLRWHQPSSSGSVWPSQIRFIYDLMFPLSSSASISGNWFSLPPISTKESWWGQPAGQLCKVALKSERTLCLQLCHVGTGEAKVKIRVVRARRLDAISETTVYWIGWCLRSSVEPSEKRIWERMDTCTSITEPLSCTPEKYNIVSQQYSNINKN